MSATIFQRPVSNSRLKFSPRYTRRTSASAPKRLGTAGAEDFSVIDDVSAIRDGQRLAHVVIGHQNADPGVLQIENDALQLQHLDRIDAGERLVQQQKTRLDHQRARDLHAPPLAARKRIALVVAHGFEAQLLDQPVHALPPLAPAHPQRLQDRHQIVFHGQLAEYRGFLRKIADAAPGALVHRHVGDVFRPIAIVRTSTRPESGLISPTIM